MSIYRNINLLFLKNISLVLSSLGMQRRLCRPKHNTNFSFLSEIKSSNIATAKNFFSIVYIIDATLFDKWFVISCDNCFDKSLSSPWGFQQICCCFLWNQCFQRSPYFIFYLHNISIMLMLKFQKEALVYHNC